MQSFPTKSAALLLAVAILIPLPLSACSKKQPEVRPPQGSYDEGGQYKPSVPDVSEQLAEAHKANGDVVAWLQIPNTTVNEAVVQTTNNEYYLRRDVKKNYAYEGCYYMDYESTMFDGGKDLARNTIIYGHNLGKPMGVKDDPEGVKFAQLLKLNDIEFAKKTPYIYLTTEETVHIFEIFSVFYSESEIEPVPYHYADYSDDRYAQLIADVKKRSVYTYEAAVGTQDKIITLSTCSYKYGTYTQNPDQRFVVMARLVQENDPYYESARLVPNENIKGPSFA